jgi:hypothetical protein
MELKCELEESDGSKFLSPMQPAYCKQARMVVSMLIQENGTDTILSLHTYG